jgi:inner membrane protein
MPTIITHPAIALGAAPCLRSLRKRFLLIVTGMLLTILPDLDVVAFTYGIPYGHMFGHRGFSHSILFAVLTSAILALFLRQARVRQSLLVWGYLFICAVSHGLLDAMTNGGLGVGLFSPFSQERIFFEFRPIEVSTLSLSRFFNGQGLFVLQNELLVVWLPAAMFFVVAFWLTKMLSKS